MGKRWLIYLGTWTGCLIFYFFYREWLSYVLLLGVTALPVLSLVLSLPMMLSARVQVRMPDTVAMGTFLVTDVSVTSKFPIPQWRCRIIARHLLWGKDWILRPGGDFPAEHCGTAQCRISHCRVYDYLGLFCLPLRAPRDFRISVRPQPVRPEPAPDVEAYLAQAWRPKAGGGFAENHELRLYRPGDHLKQIHWKLSAKTGNLMYREPMIPQGGRMLVWMYHSGGPATLDCKLGKLLWVSSFLQRRGLCHDILVYTADGQCLWHIGTEHTLKDVLDALLMLPPMVEQPRPEPTDFATWQFYVGGDGDEKA